MAVNTNSMTCAGGTANSMNVPHIGGINFGATTDTYTFFYWFKSAGTINGAILDKTAVSPNRWSVFAQLTTNGAKMQVQTWDGTTNPLINSTSTINDNAWHHFAIQRDRNSAQKLSLFVDKTQEGTSVDPLGDITNTNSIKVMGASRQGLLDTNGLMDELTIWSVLVTPTNANYQADHTGETGLQGYYQLNNNANDASANANNGTTGCTFSTDVPFANYNTGAGNAGIMYANTKYWGW